MEFNRMKIKKDKEQLVFWVHKPSGTTFSIEYYEESDTWDAKKNGFLLENYDKRSQALKRVKEEADEFLDEYEVENSQDTGN